MGRYTESTQQIIRMFLNPYEVKLTHCGILKSSFNHKDTSIVGITHVHYLYLTLFGELELVDMDVAKKKKYMPRTFI